MQTVKLIWDWMDPRKSVAGGVVFIIFTLACVVVTLPVFFWFLGVIFAPVNDVMTAWYSYWLPHTSQSCN